ncbi:hypothetical protein MSPP1_000396 [Malassezia sp. CBS 17886]|nr:hypothetical protein MSPP1_000396 [Malassezia sp. CBS 17886]
MRRWWRRGDARAMCHFCGQPSVLVPPYGRGERAHPHVPAHGVGERVSSGTPARWYCAACESWNHADTAGRPIDVWERPMWDAHMNRSDFVGAQRAVDPSPRFCRTCTTHQTLVTNLLANYLSDDDHSTDAERLAALPAYRRSLEARYPLACAACAARANAHIAAIDRRVQAECLGDWLARAQRGTDASASTPDGAYAAPARTHARLAPYTRWRLLQAHCIAVSVAGLLYSALPLLPGVSRAATLLLLCLALQPTGYDPGWRVAHERRQRGVPTPEAPRNSQVSIARGRAHAEYVQAQMHVLRAGAVACVQAHGAHPELEPWLQYLAGLCGALQFLPPLVRLVSQEVAAGEPDLAPTRAGSGGEASAGAVRGAAQHARSTRRGAAGDLADPPDDPLAGMSLSRTHARATTPPLHAVLDKTPPAGDAMDIDQPADTAPRSFPLGPQRFWTPSAPSGLEERFGCALDLDADGRRAAEGRGGDGHGAVWGVDWEGLVVNGRWFSLCVPLVPVLLLGVLWGWGGGDGGGVEKSGAVA